jgi:CubicO group peptidase (beta-lactamase class C family)
MWIPVVSFGGDLTKGVWGAAAGPETFYWEFWPEENGLGAVIHTLRDGKKQTELPVDRVIWNHPELEMQMHSTGVTYRGEVDLEAGVIEGQLFYSDEEGPQMELRQEDAQGIAGLRPRPAGAAPYRYVRPAETGDGWTTADCTSHALTVDALNSAFEAVCAGEAGVIHSLLLVAGGELVFEEYFHGYRRDDVHRLASVTKSVSSLLVGAAVDADLITGVDTPVLDFFPDLRTPVDERWHDLTLHHLLSMTMGLDWGGTDPHGTGPDFFQAILDRPVVREPGTHWAYQSANVDLLAGVLKQATGLHADRFAEKHLLGPLGITAYDWSYKATDGYRLMDGSLALRPRDMAKLGMLLRDEGRWRDVQVISADWIRRSIARHADTDGPERYGYLWWLGEFPGGEGPQPVVFANGHGSQFIAWLPKHDLIVVVTGGNEDNGKHFAITKVLTALF